MRSEAGQGSRPNSSSALPSAAAAASDGGSAEHSRSSSDSCSRKLQEDSYAGQYAEDEGNTAFGSQAGQCRALQVHAQPRQAAMTSVTGKKL